MPRKKMDPELKKRIMAKLNTGRCPDETDEDSCDALDDDFFGEAKCVECWRRSLIKQPPTEGE